MINVNLHILIFESAVQEPKFDWELYVRMPYFEYHCSYDKSMLNNLQIFFGKLDWEVMSSNNLLFLYKYGCCQFLFIIFSYLSPFFISFLSNKYIFLALILCMFHWVTLRSHHFNEVNNLWFSNTTLNHRKWDNLLMHINILKFLHQFYTREIKADIHVWGHKAPKDSDFSI